MPHTSAGLEVNLDNNNFNTVDYTNDYEREQAERSNIVISKTFLYMFGVLAISALAAYITATSEALTEMIYGNSYAFFVLIIGEIALVSVANSTIRKNNASLSAVLLIAYSVVNGMTLSVIFFVYDIGSIYSTFIVAAIMFGGLAVFGLVTKKDLTVVGRVGHMLLFGLIIVSIGHLIFFRGQAMNTVFHALGLTIFIGLTAYDTQKIKQFSADNNGYSTNVLAMFGALILYLDFINIFLKLLALFGKRRN